jgi:hypothetical protein
MAKRIIALMAVLLLASIPIFAEIELGVGLTPATQDKGSTGTSNQSYDVWNDSFKTVHLGWRTLGVLYFSGDFMVVPPGVAKGMTSYYDSGLNTWVEGIYRPAVISLYDVGLKLALKSLSFSAQVGINQFYLYKQDEIQNFNPPQIGANLKVAAGLRLVRFLGMEVGAISVQPSFKDAVDVVKGVFDKDARTQKDAVDKLVKQIIPTIQIVLYL